MDSFGIFDCDFNFNAMSIHTDLDRTQPMPSPKTKPFSAPVANMGHLPFAPLHAPFKIMNRFTPYNTTTLKQDYYSERFALSDYEDDIPLKKTVERARKNLRRQDAKKSEALIEKDQEKANRQRRVVRQRRVEIHNELLSEDIEARIEKVVERGIARLSKGAQVRSPLPESCHPRRHVEMKPTSRKSSIPAKPTVFHVNSKAKNATPETAQQYDIHTKETLSTVFPETEPKIFGHLATGRSLRQAAPKLPAINESLLTVPELPCPLRSRLAGISPVKQTPISEKCSSRTPFNSPTSCMEDLSEAIKSQPTKAQERMLEYIKDREIGSQRATTWKRTLEEEFRDAETTRPSRKRKAASKLISYAESSDEDTKDARPKTFRRSKRKKGKSE